MPYEKFITDMLNIDPAQIQDISTASSKDGEIIVSIRLRDTKCSCPVCHSQMKVHGYSPRTITHSTFVYRKCTITFRQRRYRCAECGLTVSEYNPFSKRNEGLSHETKRNILTALKEPSSTYSGVAKRFSVSATTAQRLFDRCVDIKRKRLPEVLSLDEHYFPESSFDSLYMCVLMDFDNGEITDVLPDRKKDMLIRYFSNIKNETLSNDGKISELSLVKYISIDLYENYRDIAHTYFPKALVCADSFHVIENLNKCFNDVRLRCRRNADEDMTYWLTKLRYLFNTDIYLDNRPKYNRTLGRYMNRRGMRDYMLDAYPDLKEAYELKESYISFNRSAKAKNAKEELLKQVEAFGNSSVKEMKTFYNLLLNWFDEIINSFTLHNGKRINNSYIESRNRTIESILYNANGCTNFKRTRNRIIYCINKNETFHF